MKSKSIIAILAVFIAWAILDFIIHGLLLSKQYEVTAALWRPMEEMKMGIMYGVTLISAIMFVLIYDRLISPKSLSKGILFGLLYGIALGVGMGFGTYSVMPLPMNLALAWFVGTVVETVTAGALVGWLIKD